MAIQGKDNMLPRDFEMKCVLADAAKDTVDVDFVSEMRTDRTSYEYIHRLAVVGRPMSQCFTIHIQI